MIPVRTPRFPFGQSEHRCSLYETFCRVVQTGSTPQKTRCDERRKPGQRQLCDATGLAESFVFYSKKRSVCFRPTQDGKGNTLAKFISTQGPQPGNSTDPRYCSEKKVPLCTDMKGNKLTGLITKQVQISWGFSVHFARGSAAQDQIHLTARRSNKATTNCMAFFFKCCNF